MNQPPSKELVDQVERDFFGHVWRLSERCEKGTDERIRDLGQKLPKCVERLERLTWLLGRLGTCSWGCHGGDHVVEYLVTRGVGTILSSYRCIRTGFYDQSITLTRSIGETANLLALFHADATLRAEWTAADRRGRLNKFGPVKIRLLLEKLDQLVPIEEDRYRELSEIGVHPVPGARPQDFSEHGQGQIGGWYQETAVFVTVNELAYATFFLAFFGALQADLEQDVRKEILRAAAALYRQIGGIQITNWGETKAKIQKQADALKMGISLEETE